MNNKSVLHIRMRAELKERIRNAAERMGISESAYVRLKLAELLGVKPEMALASRKPAR